MSTASLLHYRASASRSGVLAVRFLLPLFLLAAPAVATAQENPWTANTLQMYSGVKAILLRSAELMPEGAYGFRPTAAVRSFGQILGHAADSQYAFCSSALGEKNPLPRVEKTKTSKAELVAALKDAFAYCDRAYTGMTDAAGAQTVQHFGQAMPKLAVLAANNLHSVEHYGNLVTYLRLNNLVPPTSDPAFMAQMMKPDAASR